MNNTELATYFVNGRYGHGSNCQTDGTTFVSYDTAVATNHGNAVLIACAYKARNWYGSFFGTTPTTERQLLHVKRAAIKNGIAFYIVPCIFPQDRRDHERNYQYLTMIADEYRKKAERARTFESVARWDYLQATKLQEAQEYWKTFCK